MYTHANMPRTLSLSSAPSTDHQLSTLVRWVVTHNERVVIYNGGRRVAVLQSVREQHTQERAQTQQMKRNLLKRLAQIRRRNRVAPSRQSYP